jgi:hypothetical protein
MPMRYSNPLPIVAASLLFLLSFFKTGLFSAPVSLMDTAGTNAWVQSKISAIAIMNTEISKTLN